MERTECVSMESKEWDKKKWGIALDLGWIEINQQRGFVWTGNRPSFRQEVKNVFVSTGADICHSISWDTMKNMMLSYLNLAWRGYVDSALKYIENMNFIFLKLNEQIIAMTQPEDIRSFYAKRQWWQMTKIYWSLKESIENKWLFLRNANELLLLWFSAFGNLRLLCRKKWNNEEIVGNWNRSVGAAFDPQEWIFIGNDGCIYNDYRCSCNGMIKYNQYDKWDVNMPSPPGQGFYLLNECDSFILSRLFEIEICSGRVEELKMLYMYTGENGNYRYLASSSNQMDIPKHWHECDEPIYFLYIYNGGQTWVKFTDFSYAAIETFCNDYSEEEDFILD